MTNTSEGIDERCIRDNNTAVWLTAQTPALSLREDMVFGELLSVHSSIPSRVEWQKKKQKTTIP